MTLASAPFQVLTKGLWKPQNSQETQNRLVLGEKAAYIIYERNTSHRVQGEEPRTSARGSSKEKALLSWNLLGFKTLWEFIAALPSGAFWFFHVKEV